MSRICHAGSPRTAAGIFREILKRAASCSCHAGPGARGAVVFADRNQAGKLLGAELARRRRRTPLVLGVPCGGVPVARAVARAVGGELDVVLAGRLEAPHCPECAIGAATCTGHVFPRGCACACAVAADGDEFLSALDGCVRLLRMREALYRIMRPGCVVAGREVIVVDDGAVSGATLAAALNALRAERPARLTAALPIAGAGALQLARALADEVVVLERTERPPILAGWYRDFPAVMDEQVAGILARAAVPHVSRRRAQA